MLISNSADATGGEYSMIIGERYQRVPGFALNDRTKAPTEAIDKPGLRSRGHFEAVHRGLRVATR